MYDLLVSMLVSEKPSKNYNPKLIQILKRDNSPQIGDLTDAPIFFGVEPLCLSSLSKDLLNIVDKPKISYIFLEKMLTSLPNLKRNNYI